MNITELDIFHISTAILLFSYYHRSKIYLFIWIALLNIIMVATSKFTNNVLQAKIIISSYVLLVLSVYLYKLRYTLLGGDISQAKEYKLHAYNSGKNTMILPLLIWLAFNIAVRIVYKYMLR